jgi:hypothetical protein
MSCHVYLFSFVRVSLAPYKFDKNEISVSKLVRFYDCFIWGDIVWLGKFTESSQ